MKTNPLRLAGCGLIFLGILLLASGAILLVLPDSYEAMVRIKVDKDALNVQMPRSLNDPIAFDPYWIQEEFEVIQSKSILYRVITNLNLNHRWAEKFKEQTDLRTELTYSLLKKQMEVREPRHSGLLEMRVWSEDKNEAVAIANEIAR